MGHVNKMHVIDTVVILLLEQMGLILRSYEPILGHIIRTDVVQVKKIPCRIMIINTRSNVTIIWINAAHFNKIPC